MNCVEPFWGRKLRRCVYVSTRRRWQNPRTVGSLSDFNDYLVIGNALPSSGFNDIQLNYGCLTPASEGVVKAGTIGRAISSHWLVTLGPGFSI